MKVVFAGQIADPEAKARRLKLGEVIEAPEADSPLGENDRYLIAPHRADAPRKFEERWRYVADELERFTSSQQPETALSLERAKVMSES